MIRLKYIFLHCIKIKAIRGIARACMQIQKDTCVFLEHFRKAALLSFSIKPTITSTRSCVFHALETPNACVQTT